MTQKFKKMKEIIYGKDYDIIKDPYWKWFNLILLIGLGFFISWFWLLAIAQGYYVGRKKMNKIEKTFWKNPIAWSIIIIALISMIGSLYTGMYYILIGQIVIILFFILIIWFKNLNNNERGN